MYLECKPGEGGDDAAAFAAELTDALTAYARRLGRTVHTRSSTAARGHLVHLSDTAGADPLLRFAGTHRVQRVPANDKHGRRQTSTATVAVLADRPDTEVTVADRDIRVDFFRGSGPGGQHRNKTSTAVRLTHLPTGTVVVRTSGRSQAGNLADARADLTSRLQRAHDDRVDARRQARRSAQIGAGDRPAKGFTHNQQRSEVIDHRSGQRWPMRDFAQGRIG